MEVMEVREPARGTSPSPGTATAQAEVSSAADPGRCPRRQQNKGAPGAAGGLGGRHCRGRDGSLGGKGAFLGQEEAPQGQWLPRPPVPVGSEGRLAVLLILCLLQPCRRRHGVGGVRWDVGTLSHAATMPGCMAGAVFTPIWDQESLTSPQKARREPGGSGRCRHVRMATPELGSALGSVPWGVGVSPLGHHGRVPGLTGAHTAGVCRHTAAPEDDARRGGAGL